MGSEQLLNSPLQPRAPHLSEAPVVGMLSQSHNGGMQQRCKSLTYSHEV
jgi:hypothetical protein